MIPERVQLNGTEENVTCPECGLLVKFCCRCEKGFVVGDTARCFSDDHMKHCHDDCWEDLAPDEDEDDEEEVDE